MQQRDVPAIIVSPYTHLAQVLDQTDISHVVSILGQSDKLNWPDVGSRRVLRLQFDDITYSSGKFIAPTREQIVELVEFGRNWNGAASILIHCRAGSSRSPGAAAIVAAALGRADTSSLVRRVALSKAYFRPHVGMLALADSVLGVTPGLVEVVRSLPAPTRTDDWGPIRIPLVAPSDD
jgi:predicted protein tyrosine phosphatase